MRFVYIFDVFSQKTSTNQRARNRLPVFLSCVVVYHRYFWLNSGFKPFYPLNIILDQPQPHDQPSHSEKVLCHCCDGLKPYTYILKLKHMTVFCSWHFRSTDINKKVTHNITPQHTNSSSLLRWPVFCLPLRRRKDTSSSRSCSFHFWFLLLFERILFLY